MDPTYTMIGGDGQQYGPISLEQLKSWIAEGRVTAETKILRSDTQSWLPAANYVELGLAQPAPLASPRPISPPPISAGPSAPAPFPQQAGAGPILARKVRNDASWFYWIAAFSIINFFAATHMGVFFIVGLGVTLITGSLIATAVAAAVFGLLGFFAGRGQSWAFIVGMVLYALDGLIFIAFRDWLSIAFHAYALYRIFMGLKANMELNAQGR